MKKLLISLMLTMTLFVGSVGAQVSPRQQNQNGTAFVQLYNSSPHDAYSCYIRDNSNNFYTFYVYPQSASRWYPVYGYYEWQCE
jgi:hypothetical protein